MPVIEKAIKLAIWAAPAIAAVMSTLAKKENRLSKHAVARAAMTAPRRSLLIDNLYSDWITQLAQAIQGRSEKPTTSKRRTSFSPLMISARNAAMTSPGMRIHRPVGVLMMVLLSSSATSITPHLCESHQVTE